MDDADRRYLTTSFSEPELGERFESEGAGSESEDEDSELTWAV